MGNGRSYICRIVMISGRLTIMTASGFVVISYLAGMIHDTRTTRGTEIKSFPSLILLPVYVKTQNSKDTMDRSHERVHVIGINIYLDTFYTTRRHPFSCTVQCVLCWKILE